MPHETSSTDKKPIVMYENSMAYNIQTYTLVSEFFQLSSHKFIGSVFSFSLKSIAIIKNEL